MKTKLIPLSILLLIACTCTGQSIARQVISTAGDYASTADASISWTIGEPVTETFTSNNYILLQGFQQGGEYIISPPDGNEKGLQDIHFQIYPNPAEDLLIIELKDKPKEHFTVKLFSISGKLILTQPIEPYSNLNYINLSKIQSGTYIIKIMDKNRISTFKLIKK
jgi:hypothetical protein